MARERRVRQSGGGNKIGAFLLGILMGIIIIVGALAGAGYYVYTSPIKDTVELIDGGENGKIYQALFGTSEKVGFLNPAYADEKVSTLISDTSTAIEVLTGDEGALVDLDGLSPKVRDTVKTLLETTDTYDIPFDEDELMNTPIDGLKDYATTQIKETSLGGLLKGFNEGKETQDKLMLALCYGEEGVHYEFDDEGNVQMIGNAQKTTVKELVEGGADEQFDRITLEALDVDTSDPIMRTLTYGPASHYTLENGKVTMNPMSFTYDGTKLYDIDGKEAEGTFNATDKTLTLDDGTVYYLDTVARGGEPTLYYAYSDEARTKRALYPKTKVLDLTKNSDTLIDDLYLSDAMNINNQSHQVLISLAYGSKENYTVDPITGNITPVEGFTPRTIGELKKDNEDIINGIYLKDALNIDKTSHKVLIAIAYGTKDVDYYYDTNGDIQMHEGKEAKTLGDLSGEAGEELIENISIADALDVTTASHRVLISIAYGNEGENYDIIDGVITPRPGEENQPRTLASLSGEQSEEVINGIYLADALNLTPTSDKVLITLAYGKEGVDYEIDGNKFVMLGDSKPRKLSDLSGDMTPILNDIALADVMDPDFDSPMIMYLLYGREGIHYEVVSEKPNQTVKLLQQRIAIYNGNVYNPYGEQLVAVLEGANQVKITTGTGADAVTTIYEYVELPTGVKPATLTLKIGDVEVEAPYYYLELNGNPVYYQSTTLGELSGENNAISLLTKRLTLGEILGKEAVENNIFLSHVQNETIDGIPAAIENLKFTDVYASDIFKTATDGNGKTYYIDAIGNNVDTNGDGELSEEEKKNRVVTSTWWYLLHNDKECHDSNCPDGKNCTKYYDDNASTVCTEARRCEINSCGLGLAACHEKHCHLGDACPETGNGECDQIPDCTRKGCIHDYKITEFDALAKNMTNNMQSATLLCLQLDKIINLEDGTLKTALITEMTFDVNGDGDADDVVDIKVEVAGVPKRADGTTNKKFLQEMTIAEIMTYASNVLKAIETFQGLLNAPRS